MKSVRHLFPVIIWVTFHLFGVFANASKEENVALKKPVSGIAGGHAKLVDGNLDTVLEGRDDMVPMYYIDLKDVYRLSRIELYAPKQAKFEKGALNRSFSLYSWTNYTSWCDMEGLYPWNPLKANLSFKSLGDKIVVEQSVEAQYIIVLTDFVELYETHRGMPMAELKAFGTKIRDGYRYHLPENGTYMPNTWNITRQAILKDQKRIYAQASYFYYLPDVQFRDVSLAWRYNRTNTMVAIRGKARMALFSGPKVLRRLLTWSDYQPLRDNLRRWLTEGNENAKFVNVTDAFKDGDILLITRFHKFDPEAIAKLLKEGKNSAVITYLAGRKDKDSNRVARLMRAMEIKYAYVNTTFGNLDQDVSEFINSFRDVPWDYQLKVGINSWYQFSTELMHYHVPRVLLYTDYYQGLVRQVLEKYRDLATYLAPCRDHDYRTNNITDIAMINYNKVLLMQRGGDAMVAPGALRSPGYVKHIAKEHEVVLEFKPDILNLYIPTGCYAKPGRAVYYEVLEHSAPAPDNHIIQINPQMDTLMHKPAWGRWPIVFHKENTAAKGVIVSPFGGPIVLTIEQGQSLKLKLRNVYRYPWFDIRDPNAASKWNEEKAKYKGTPYLMVAGDMMHSMFDESYVLHRSPEVVRWSVNFMDNLVKVIMGYRGLNYEEQRHEVYVTDDDISIGYGHNGYPWASYKGATNAFFNVEWLKAGKSILFPHEIGHNFQAVAMTFINGGEVTNNAFIPVMKKYLCGIDGYARGEWPGSTDGEMQDMVNTWKGNKYVGVNVNFYNYLAKWFGPGLLSNVWAHAPFRARNYGNAAQRIAFWMKWVCIESGRNMVPFHMLWHFPLQQSTIDECNKFQCWLPEDEFTKQAPETVNAILAKYPGCSRAKPQDVPYKRNITRGVDEIRPQKIFLQMA